MPILMIEGDEGGGSPAIVIPATPAPIDGSVSTSIPTTPVGSTALAERPFLDSIPTEFRDKPWVQEFAKNEKPWDALLKSHAGALDIVGRKGVEVPSEGASPEIIAAFNKAIGVPEKPDGYAYAPPDFSNESEAVKQILNERVKDTSFINTMRAKAHEAGLSPKQFTALATTFDAKQIAQIKEQVTGRETAATAYKATESKLLKETYGDSSDASVQLAKDTLAKIIPQSIRDSKNPNLALLAAGLFIHEKVFKNDTVGGTNLGAPQLSKDDIRAQILKLRQDPGFRDPFARNNKDITQKVDALYNQLHAAPPKE